MYELDSCSVAASYAAAAVFSWHCAAFAAECVPGHQAHLLRAVNIFAQLSESENGTRNKMKPISLNFISILQSSKLTK